MVAVSFITAFLFVICLTVVAPEKQSVPGGITVFLQALSIITRLNNPNKVKL
jgi:hypothetical protein